MIKTTKIWQKVPLFEVADIWIGGTPSRNKLDYWDYQKSTQNVWVSIRDLSNLKDKYISDSAEYISDEGVKKSNVKLIPSNTVLMSFKLSIGKVAISNKPLYTNEAIASFNLKNRNELDLIYLYYALPTLSYDTDVAVKGSTLNKAKLNTSLLPLPEFRIQKKIGEVLSSVGDSIQETDQIIQKTEVLKKGLMRGLFDETEKSDWKLEKFGNVTNFIDYRGKTPRRSTSGIPLITAKNVRMGYMDPEPREYIRSEDYDTWMTRGIPKNGDVLFTTEAPLGNVAQIDTDEKVAFAQRVIILQPQLEISPIFLKYLLMSYRFQKLVQSLGTGGTVKGIKAKTLKQVDIPVPPRDVQIRIADILTAVDYKIDKEKKIKNELVILKKGLMQDIFSQKVQIN